MHKRGSCLLAGMFACVASGAAQAQGPHSFSANVGLFSDYIYRGISQTERGPAVQGGFDYAYDAGDVDAYLGVWGSNVEFGGGDDNSLELDVYGGLTGELLNSGIGWDVGGIYYIYPKDDSDSLDFGEAYLGLDYTFQDAPLAPTLATYVYYSPDFSGNTGDAYYINPSLGLSLPHDFSLNLSYGYQDVDDIGNYSNWSVGVSRDISIFTLGLSYSETFDDDDFCTGNPNCDDTFVFSVSSSF